MRSLYFMRCVGEVERELARLAPCKIIDIAETAGLRVDDVEGALRELRARGVAACGPHGRAGITHWWPVEPAESGVG